MILLQVKIYNNDIEGPFPEIPTSADIADGSCDLLVFGFTDKKWSKEPHENNEVLLNDCVPQRVSVRIAEDSLCQKEYNDTFIVKNPYHICGTTDTSFTDNVSTQ